MFISTTPPLMNVDWRANLRATLIAHATFLKCESFNEETYCHQANAGSSTSDNTNMVLDREDFIDLELVRCRHIYHVN